MYIAVEVFFLIYNFSIGFWNCFYGGNIIFVFHFLLTIEWPWTHYTLYSRQPSKRCYIFLLPWGDKSYTSKCWKTKCKGYINKETRFHHSNCQFLIQIQSISHDAFHRLYIHLHWYIFYNFHHFCVWLWYFD